MAMTGGLKPFDQSEALAGSARLLIAPKTAPVPTSLYDIIPAVANGSGEYPAITPWRDTGLSADSPTFSENTESEGLEYEQPTGTLFDVVTNIERLLTAQIAGIGPKNLALIHNVPEASIVSVAASAGKPAASKIPFGAYDSLLQYRACLVGTRPGGADDVTEPTTNLVRPAMAALILPLVSLDADEREFEFSKSDPVNVECAFRSYPEPTLPAKAQGGFWFIEKGGVITA